MIRPADLPGWVLTRSTTPSGTRSVAAWCHGTLVTEGHDLDPLQRALGSATARVAAAATALLTKPNDAGLALVAISHTRAARAQRWSMVNQASVAGYLITYSPARLLSCAAVWTYADNSELEPLWCTAAAAGIPLIWVSPTTPPEEALRHAPVVDSRRPQR